MLPASTVRSTPCSAGREAPSNVSATPRSSTRPRPAGSGGASARRDDRRLAVEHLEDARAGGGRALGRAEHVAERPHRAGQHQHVAVEGGEDGDVDRAVDRRAPADEQDRGEAEVGEEADQRRVARLQPRRVHRLLEDAAGLVAEALELQLLARERLHDAHAGDVLLRDRGQLGDPLLDLLHRGARAAAVAECDERSTNGTGASAISASCGSMMSIATAASASVKNDWPMKISP